MSNNCYELGQVAREDEARKLAMFKEGSKIREELRIRGAQMKEEKHVSSSSVLFHWRRHEVLKRISYFSRFQARLLELKRDQTEAESVKNEKEAVKKTIEEQEKVALDAHKKLEEEQREILREAERIKNEEEARKSFKEIDKNGDGLYVHTNTPISYRES